MVHGWYQNPFPTHTLKRPQSDERDQRELKIQARCGHGSQDAEQDEKQLCPRVEVQGLHLVIPAFSNCFLSILQPAKALTAAAMTSPASMMTRIHVVPVERIVSI